MIKASRIILLLVLMIVALWVKGQQINQTQIAFDFNWRFAVNDHPGADRFEFNDTRVNDHESVIVLQRKKVNQAVKILM